MNAKKPRSHVLTVVVILALAGSILAGSVVAKYIRSFQLDESKVTFTAKLATSITLQEHKADRQSDGNYVLNNAVTVESQSYELMPGLDIPKDPFITIIGKTPIDAYLFVEVLDATPNEAISYAMSSDWKSLGIEGKNGGAVYVYTGGGAEPKVVDEAVGDNFDVFLLYDNKVTVGQKLLSSDTDNMLTFYACMGETAFSSNADATQKAIEVYKKLNNMT